MASSRMMSARASPSLGRLRGAKPALVSRPGRVAPPVRASAAQRGRGSTDDYVVTLVNISVTPGNEEGFVAHSVDNATNSVEEPDNRRFDVLQDLDDPSKFALLEVYSTSEGNDAHRDLPHSKAWREGVKDWMAEKRTWSVYKPVYPWAGLWGTAAASRRAKDGVQQPVQAAFLTLDKDGDTAGAKAAAEDTKQITHVHVTCKPGTEDEFIEACLANAASSVLEPDNLRFDVLRHSDEPNKFMLVEVYATSEGPVAHKATPHYNEWRTTVEPFMQEPRRARKFRAVFPTDPAAWKMTLNDN